MNLAELACSQGEETFLGHPWRRGLPIATWTFLQPSLCCKIFTIISPVVKSNPNQSGIWYFGFVCYLVWIVFSVYVIKFDQNLTLTEPHHLNQMVSDQLCCATCRSECDSTEEENAPGVNSNR